MAPHRIVASLLKQPTGAFGPPSGGGLSAMLDVLRKHASSWVIKVILGAIVISFIFFFGYGAMRRDPRGGDDAVATVNGTPIPTAEYRFLLDQNYDRLRKSFPGQEVPEFVQKMAISSTLGQLISKELAIAQANELGVVVPDAELAAIVMGTPAAQRDGEFDAIFYRTEFQPYFKRRFGIEYESYLEQDLKIEALTKLFRNIDQSPPFPDGPDRKDLKWTFETVTLDPAAMKEELKSVGEAKELARLLMSSEPAHWREMLRPFGAQVVKVGPLWIRNRGTLLEGLATFDDQRTIFSLTEENPVLAEPIERGGKIYVVRLVERIAEENPARPSWPLDDYLRSWMAKLRDKAKIVSFLDTEE